MDYSKVTVILPTLNEERCVGPMIDALRRLYPGIRLRIVDDGSSDGTAREARWRITPEGDLTFHDRSGAAVKGLTASVLDALDALDAEVAPWFVVMDCDFQHPPEAVGALLERLAQGYPLVIGVRDNAAFHWKFSRLLMQRLAGFGSRARLLLSGVHVQDPMSGFFAGEVALVREVTARRRRRFVARGYKVLFDLLKALPPGAGISGVRYEFNPRKLGSSKMSLTIALRILQSWLT